jgi:hypothetical protein
MGILFKILRPLEILRTDQRPEEVHQQTDGNDSDNDVFGHGLKPPAGVCVKNADHEKSDGGEHVNDVHHG